MQELLLRLGLHGQPVLRKSRGELVKVLVQFDRPGVQRQYCRMSAAYSVRVGVVEPQSDLYVYYNAVRRFSRGSLQRIWDALDLPPWYRVPVEAEHGRAVNLLLDFTRWLRLPWWTAAVVAADGDAELLIERIAQERGIAREFRGISSSA